MSQEETRGLEGLMRELWLNREDVHCAHLHDQLAPFLERLEALEQSMDHHDTALDLKDETCERCRLRSILHGEQQG